MRIAFSFIFPSFQINIFTKKEYDNNILFTSIPVKKLIVVHNQSLLHYAVTLCNYIIKLYKNQNFYCIKEYFVL